MRALAIAVLAVPLAASAAGCGNLVLNREIPSNMPRFAYAATSSSGAGSIAAFTVNSSSGGLTAAGAFSVSAAPVDIGTDAFGTFVYTANADQTISGFTIDRNSGALTAIPGTFAAGSGPVSLAVDPGARFLYVANAGSNNITAFTINTTTGVLTAVATSPFPTGSAPQKVILDPSGRFVYAACGDAGIEDFFINGDGSLALQQTAAPAGITSARAIAVEPRGKFAYVADGIGSVAVYSIEFIAGSLTPIPALTVTSGTQPVALTTDPAGNFLFVANSGSNDLAPFAINSQSGTLTRVSANVAAPATPVGLAVDPSGRFLYVASSSGEVSVFRINGGSLAAISSVNAGVASSAVAVTP